MKKQPTPVLVFSQPATRLERFRQMLTDVEKDHGSGELTEIGVAHAIAAFEKSIPVARSIAVFGNPLNEASDTLNAFIAHEQAGLTDDGEKTMAEEKCRFFVGLALGFILADQV